MPLSQDEKLRLDNAYRGLKDRIEALENQVTQLADTQAELQGQVADITLNLEGM